MNQVAAVSSDRTLGISSSSSRRDANILSGENRNNSVDLRSFQNLIQELHGLKQQYFQLGGIEYEQQAIGRKLYGQDAPPASTDWRDSRDYSTSNSSSSASSRHNAGDKDRSVSLSSEVPSHWSADRIKSSGGGSKSVVKAALILLLCCSLAISISVSISMLVAIESPICESENTELSHC